MGFRDRIRSRLGYIDWSAEPTPNGNGKHATTQLETKAAPKPPVSFIPRDAAGRTVEHPEFGRAKSAQVTRATAYAVAAYCYVAMKYRAEKYSEAPLMVVEEGKDGEEWLPDHELARTLDEPSPDFDMGDLLALTRLYRDQTGMALWVKDRSRSGEIARITPFSGDEFEVRPDRDTGRIYGTFIVQTASGPRTYGPEDVVFFREPNPSDWWTGLAPVDVALSLLDLSSEVRDTAKNLLANAVFPSLVLQTHPDWNPDDEEWELFKEQLAEHALSENKGRPLAITGGGRATVVSTKIADLVPGELLDRVEASVAAVFGVPAVVLQYLVGLKNSPWSQMEEARRMCYEDTIETLWKRDESALTRQLLRPIDPDPSHLVRFDRSGIRALQADDTKRAAVVAQLADVWTVDEARIYTGKEPLNDEIGRAIIAHARPQPFAAPASREPATGEDSQQEKSIGGPTHAARRSTPPLHVKNDDRDAAWKAFDIATKAQEEIWTAQVYRQLQRDKIAVLALTDEVFGLGEKADPLVDWGLILRLLSEIDAYAAFSRRDWDEVVEPLIDSTGRSAVRTLASEIAIAFDLLIPGLSDYTIRHSAWLITQINNTTRSAIASTLETGFRNGESIERLRQRIEAADAAFGKSRAELIARTETTTVYNGARHESMLRYARESGERVEKSWLSSRDARVRDEHRALDDETWIPIDQPFANGLMAPGEPNCRCTALHRIPEDDE